MKRILLIVFAIAYCVSPDLFIGPVDDAVVALLAGLGSFLFAKKDKDN